MRAGIMAAMMVATAAAIPAPARDTVADGMLRDAIRRRVQQKTMSKADMLALYKLLDDNKDGKLGVKEMIDLFDGQNDDSMVVKDCNGKNVPHHWLGDGFCDGGNIGTGAHKHGDFNCNIFACDNGDCNKKNKGKGRCRRVKGRDRVELKVGASAVYGHIKDRKGDIFVVDLLPGTTYHIWTNTQDSPYQCQDTVLSLYASDGHSLLARNDNAVPGIKASSYVKFSPVMAVTAAVVKVVGKSRLDRGSFMIHVSTKPPTCLKQLDCMSVCGGKDKYDVCGTCKGKILDKLKCPRN